MSIITGTGGNFSYPSLGMAGWLCSSFASGTCTTPGCPNNSPAEGEVFYNEFTTSAHPAGYKLTGILNCDGAEGVTVGTDPDSGSQYGYQAIEQHMNTQCSHPSPQ